MFFFRKRPYFLRIFSLTCLLSTLQATLAPTISWALTAGPMAPEFSSFEPVDTTDMVNLSTGDFTYNIPLLEVPGPEGSYPVALSYHAGIGPDEESSWVGLGWSLNPGALNRYVNGVPDDMNGSGELIRDTWEGGYTRITSLGIGIGMSAGEGQLGVGFGMAFGNDTYKGSDIGGNFHVGYTSQSGIGVGFSTGSNPYGEQYSTFGVTASAKAGYGFSSSAGLGVGVVSGDASITASAKGRFLDHAIGGSASISTSSGQVTSGVYSISNSQSINRNAGVITSRSDNFDFTLPLPYGISLSYGRNVTRYYIDQMDYSQCYGALYVKNIPVSGFGNVVFDCVSFKEFPTYDSEPDAGMGGSIPSYDTYQVLGQGIGGSIQPYIFEHGSLFRKTAKDNNGVPVNGVYFDYAFRPFENKVGFRFVNDFANAYIKDVPTSYNSSTEYLSGIVNSIGEDRAANPNNSNDFNKENGMLAGSRHIEWFTNQEIYDATKLIQGENEAQRLVRLSNLKGFIPDLVNRSNYLEVQGEYGQDAPDNIGGFLVTNKTGVSYHYSIPVYNFSDYTEQSSSVSGESVRKIMKSLPYAYTWLMTGITGPDYVDRPPYGVIDDNDWGYWVKFDYGKWTDKYIWRNPVEGSNKDLNSRISVFSSGRKELYYLNAIKTRSHTALFVKDMKRDGKGVGNSASGGFNMEFDPYGNVVSLPAATLKLNKILLFNNRVLDKELEKIGLISSTEELQALGSDLNHVYTVTVMGGIPDTRKFHSGEKILDIYDIVDTGIENAAMRQVVFDYDYSLCPQTPNSFDLDYIAENYAISDVNSGKLTLNGYEILGLNSSKIIPSTGFEYCLADTPYNKDARDVWGMYKSDYTVSESERRRTRQVTSDVSSENVMAWSLSKIKTPLGAEIIIEYESDQIRNTGLTDFQNFSVKSVDPLGGNIIRLGLYTNVNLQNYISLGDSIDLKLLLWVDYPQNDFTCPVRVEHLDFIKIYNKLQNEETCPVLMIGNDYIDVMVSGTLFDNLNNYHCDGFMDTYLKLDIGNVIVSNNSQDNKPGGGIRVKSIGLRHDNTENVTIFQYLNGTTSYEPVDLNIHYHGSNENFRRVNYHNLVYPYYHTILANSAFLPPPGVLYEEVIVQDIVRHYNSPNSYTELEGVGSTKYVFSVFDKNLMMPRSGSSKTLTSDNYDLQIVRFKNLGNRSGLLKSVTNYSGANATGNVLSRTENRYLHDSLTETEYEQALDQYHSNQGRTDQAFFERKVVNGANKLQITEIEEYPVINFATYSYDGVRGLESEYRVLGYDFFSGNPLISVASDANGNKFMREEIPAYRKYPSLGHRVNNGSNRHMLDQMAATYIYKAVENVTNPVSTDDYTTTAFIGASAITWTDNLSVIENNKQSGVGIINQANTWRMNGSYIWTGNSAMVLNNDGTFNLSDFSHFDFANPESNSDWRKVSTVNYVNNYSKVLEVSDMNNVNSSAICDPSSKYVIASAANAARDEIAYTGCEFKDYYTINSDPVKSILEGYVKLGNGAVVNDKNRAHTGMHALKVDKSQEGFSYSFLPRLGKYYRASVWVHIPNFEDESQHLDYARIICRYKDSKVQIGGMAILNEKFKANAHHLINLDISADQISLINGVLPEIEFVCLNRADQSIYFDDFRVSPLDASLFTYVYDLDNGRLTHILNNENLYQRFEYDDMGTLRKVFQELFYPAEKIVSEQSFNYGKNHVE